MTSSTLLLRLRGGGKRGASKALQEEKEHLSNDEKIDTKKSELKVLLVQLRGTVAPTKRPSISHVVRVLDDG